MNYTSQYNYFPQIPLYAQLLFFPPLFVPITWVNLGCFKDKEVRYTMRQKKTFTAFIQARFKRWCLLTSLCYALILGLVVGFGLSAMPVRAATPNAWQKSVTLQSQWSGDFGSSNTDASLQQAAQTNANYATFIIQLRQDNLYSTYIYKDNSAPTDAALIHAISKAHSLGLKVALKIHLDDQAWDWRAYINPSDRNTWFSNYSNWLNYYATLGQQNQVDEIVVGAELISMSTSTSNPDNTQRWYNMIAQVRQRFNGKLTYSANWGGSYFSEEFTHISFWDALDYIGISAYFNLVNYNNPSVSDLINSWNYWDSTKIQPFQQSVGKPVLFTEIGYRSVDGAAINPWDSGRQANYNAQEQVNAIQALTQYWSNYSWFAGMHYWDWSTNPQCCGAGDTDYKVQNKPGQDTMRSDYSSSGGSVAPSYLLVGSSVTPDSGAPGTKFTLNSSVKASTTSSALVDMEVYDASGNKIFQQYASNQNFTAGQTSSFSFNWSSPSSQALGQYTLSVGVFSNDWQTSYLWSGNAGSFAIVANSPTPTPTPTSAPPTTTSNLTPTPTPTPPAPTSYTLSVWWPSNGVTLSGVQPFKARLENLALSQYVMYWQVDGGQLNLMNDQTTDGDHKEVWVDVSSWNWRGTGPYTINFVAKDLGGNTLQQQAVQIYVQS